MSCPHMPLPPQRRVSWGEARWPNRLTFADASAYRGAIHPITFWGLSCRLFSPSTWLTCAFRRPSTVMVLMR